MRGRVSELDVDASDDGFPAGERPGHDSSTASKRSRMSCTGKSHRCVRTWRYCSAVSPVASILDVGAVPASPLAAVAAVGEITGGQNEQSADRVDVAGFVGGERRTVRRDDVVPVRAVQRQPGHRWLIQRSTRCHENNSRATVVGQRRGRRDPFSADRPRSARPRTQQIEQLRRPELTSPADSSSLASAEHHYDAQVSRHLPAGYLGAVAKTASRLIAVCLLITAATATSARAQPTALAAPSATVIHNGLEVRNAYVVATTAHRLNGYFTLINHTRRTDTLLGVMVSGFPADLWHQRLTLGPNDLDELRGCGGSVDMPNQRTPSVLHHAAIIVLANSTFPVTPGLGRIGLWTKAPSAIRVLPSFSISTTPDQ
ncbi:MAG: hypothetical protein QOG53_2651 [Frankiales bacterium]|nr:hypothetical protein [Frankiales bacterium]